MRLTSALCALATAGNVLAQAPGYVTNYTTLPNNDTFTFGEHYAVLNLDLITALVAGVNSSTEGQSFIAATQRWINATHSVSPVPLHIFTRIYFTNALRPEIGPETPFGLASAQLGNVTASSVISQIYPAFETQDTDVVLQKSRYYAGSGNGLDEILRSQLIDTVVISGIRTSGVVLNTAYTLFNLNYNVFVITDTCIETPASNGSFPISSATAIDQSIKEGILPKLPVQVITLDQAIGALGRSGVAVPL